uniref:Uncharacterized protein n=1 Tax=Candidatus Kentrum eta TaxID=2126337 RepID=A0A450UWU5_9GAMM|nr:MAG: hypothetical protein BECKH772A_GA0070896_101008 [Candidatus Kentron sp. H]VFJ96989.1 MAG: hypothetical protein BECKH772B_GA0070898_101028 [Candidatus Kentron sp. H]VFK02661.1 MAG: hypothetical protein BECKH772C_GA0070978_100988 [Candidatus Kentron sp. H]
MAKFDSSGAHSPWTNLGEVLGQVSQSPSDAFNAAFLRVCEIRDELLALAKEQGTPIDDRIVTARRFDPHEYTQVFPLDPKQWREEHYERYRDYRKRLDDWIEAEDTGTAAELGLFGEHLDLLALHYQLGEEITSRQELMDRTFGSYTQLRRAADQLPEIAGWSRRLVDVLNATVLRWYGGVLVLVLVLIAILILGLFQWRGIASTQEELRAEIQQGIAATRENTERALREVGNVAKQLTDLGQRVGGLEQDKRIAAMQSRLKGLQDEIQQGVAATRENTERALREIGNVTKQLTDLGQRVDGIEKRDQRIVAMQNRLEKSQDEIQQGIAATREGTDRALAEIGNVVNRLTDLGRRVGGLEQDQRIVAMQSQLEGLQRENTRLAKMMEGYPNAIRRSEERLLALDRRVRGLKRIVGESDGTGEPLPPQPEGLSESIQEPRTSAPILERIAAMETDQELLKEALRSSEQELARIEENATALRDTLKGLRDAR